MLTKRMVCALACALMSIMAEATDAAYREAAPARRERDSKFIISIGDEAPTFQFVSNDGDTIDSDLLRGQVVVLLFAASWCPFSQAQLIDMQDAIWDKYEMKQDFAMIIVCEDSEEDHAIFLKQREENEIRIPFAFDANETVYRLFATPNGSVTRTVVITPDWRIAELQDKHTRQGMRKIRRCVRRLLSGIAQ